MPKRILTQIQYELTNEELKTMLSSVLPASDLPENMESLSFHREDEWIGSGNQYDAPDSEVFDSKNYKSTWTLSINHED